MGLLDSIGNFVTNEINSLTGATNDDSDSSVENSDSDNSVENNDTESDNSSTSNFETSVFTDPITKALPSKDTITSFFDNFTEEKGDVKSKEIEDATSQLNIVNERSGLGVAGPEAWCAKFVTSVAQDAGIQLDSGVNWDYVPAIHNYADQKGAYFTDVKQAQKGDWVIFNNHPESQDADSGDDHIGLVEQVLPDGTIVTIEGNTQPVAYSDGCSTTPDDVPDQVARKMYSPQDFLKYQKIQGFVDPYKLSKHINFTF